MSLNYSVWKVWNKGYNVAYLKQRIQAEIASICSAMLQNICNSVNFHLQTHMDNIPKR
jgi:hypothetical protein